MKIRALLLLLPLMLLASKCKDRKYRFDAESYILLEKGGCFGMCPIYQLRVNGVGEVSYHGERFVEVEGKHQARLSPAETNALFRAFEASSFWGFKDAYDDPNVVDLPTIYLTYSDGERTKRIKDYYGTPEEIKALEAQVEAVAVQQGWLKKTP